MKVELITKTAKTGKALKEQYDIKNDSDPNEWGRNIVDNFNATLRPHEEPRELVVVNILEQESETTTRHNWIKQNLYTVNRGGIYYDIVKCSKCGITGKRFRIDTIRRDSKYKAKIYDTCENSIKQLEKLSRKAKHK